MPSSLSPLPKSVREYALKHQVNVGRDREGYYVRDPASGQVIEWTRSAKPTVAQAKAMVRRVLERRRAVGLEPAQAPAPRRRTTRIMGGCWPRL